MSVLGVGVDVVAVSRFATVLARTPSVATRLFDDSELVGDRPERLAARFAAKEAVAKALGAPAGLRWRDTRTSLDPTGRPRLTLHGGNAAVAAELGIRQWHLSLSHDGGVAVALVVAEG